MKEIGTNDLRSGDLVLQDSVLAKHRAGDIDMLIARLDRLGLPLARLKLDGTDTDEDASESSAVPAAEPQEVHTETLLPLEVSVGRLPFSDMDDFLNIRGESRQVRSGARRALAKLHNRAVDPRKHMFDSRIPGYDPAVYNPEEPVFFTRAGDAGGQLDPLDDTWCDYLVIDIDALTRHLKHDDIRNQEGVGPHIANAIIHFVNDEITRASEQAA